MAAIFLRTVIIYVLLTVSMRFSGRRQLGQMRLPEIVATLVLSEIAALPLTDADIPLLYAVIPILTLTAAEVIFSYLSTKSSALKRMIGTAPVMIIEKGKINPAAMEKSRISLDDLLIELRCQGVCSVDEVDYAILEENGCFSIIPKGDKKPVTLGDMGKNDACGVAHPAVIDGHAVTYGLIESGHDENWLCEELKKRKLRVRDVFIMTVDDAGKIFILEKRGGSKK
ncbi:MAG: DUF421 domain-containing protein [Clostridiales bacterium]|nr:DUF421 domain-containing protein [Clostridiales bacterium]